jgi:hypothetical protein
MKQKLSRWNRRIKWLNPLLVLLPLLCSAHSRGADRPAPTATDAGPQSTIATHRFPYSTIYHSAAVTDAAGQLKLIHTTIDGQVIQTDANGTVEWKRSLEIRPNEVSVLNLPNGAYTIAIAGDTSIKTLSSDDLSVTTIHEENAPLWAVTLWADPDNTVVLACGGIKGTLAVYHRTNAGWVRQTSTAFNQPIQILRHATFSKTVPSRRDGLVVSLIQGLHDNILKAFAYHTHELIPLFDLAPPLRGPTTGLTLCDVNQDGIDDIALIGGKLGKKVMLYTTSSDLRRGELVREHSLPGGFVEGGICSAAWEPSAPPQIIANVGTRMYVFDAGLNLTERFSAPFCFGKVNPSERHRLLLLSSDLYTGDCAYLVRMPSTGLGKSEAAALEGLPLIGRQLEIRQNSLEVIRQLQSRPPSVQGKNVRHVINESYNEYDSPTRREQTLAEIKQKLVLLKTDPLTSSPAITYAFNLWFSEKNIIAHTPKWNAREDRLKYVDTAEQILEAVRQLRKERIFFTAQIAHGSHIFVSIDTVRKMAEAGGEYLVGFETSEVESDNAAMRELLETYWRTVQDICLVQGKKAFIRMKLGQWAYFPSRAWFWRSILDEKYKEVVVLSVEDSSTRARDLNLLARFGLVLEGFRNLDAKFDDDFFNSTKSWDEGGLVESHIPVTSVLAQILCGGNYAQLHVSAITDGEWASRKYGERTFKIIAGLLGSGLLFAPSPSQMLNISKTCIVIEERDDSSFQTRIERNHRHGTSGISEPAKPHAFDRLAHYWGRSSSAKDLANALWGRQFMALNHVPGTRYGIVPVLSSHSRITKDFTHIIYTDGDRIRDANGSYLEFDSERYRQVRAEAEKANAHLPYQCREETVFVQAVKIDETTERLFAMETTAYNPQKRTISLRLPAEITEARDALTGETINITDKQEIVLTIPVGCFRIVDCKKRRS